VGEDGEGARQPLGQVNVRAPMLGGGGQLALVGAGDHPGGRGHREGGAEPIQLR
jgi:hypothetical protein